jgi:DNA-binding NarL/FixJ family response regulator
MPLAVFLIEDDRLSRSSVGLVLAEVLDAKVVGMAETSDDAIAWVAVNEGIWDLAVLDLFLKEGTGFTVLSRMTMAQRRRCVVLTNMATPAKIALCVDLGAGAVFDKALQLEAFLNYCEHLSTAKDGIVNGSTA